MTNVSSYLDYLPPFLWSQENDPSQFLGRMLCIFEKILTGINMDAQVVRANATTDSMSKREIPVRVQDETSIVHGNNEHDNFEKIIDELHLILNPWHTNFLPWLASLVALPLQNDWSEYQQRKLISEIVSIYQEHGLKKGLNAYLDIYGATGARPRIAIDDGDAIFRATFLDNGNAVLHAVAHTSAISQRASLVTALLHPSAIATDKDNNYIVIDKGNISLPIPQYPSLWKVSSTGDIDYVSTSSIPIPHPIHSGSPLENPTGVVVDHLNRYSVVDIGTITKVTSLDSAIYRFAPPEYTPIKVIDSFSTPTFPAVHPVDMILSSSESFVVLDRGSHPLGDPPQGTAREPKIVVVSEKLSLAVTSHILGKVVEPTALVMDSNGRFIVADAKEQSTPTPADLVIVDPKSEWSETPLLCDLSAEENPLIFPTGLAFENPQSLLVCDTGVRWGFGDDDESYRSAAEPAAIYRIDLSQTPPSPPTIARVTYERKLVNPTKMMIDRKGKLIITDQGEFQKSTGNIPQREWRIKANEFGASVLFSQQRYTTFDNRNQIRRQIADIIDEQKPGHVSWWMKS